MSRWTGSWLSGPRAAGYSGAEPAEPGVRLGLPASGPSSAAGYGARAVAYLVDAVMCGLVAGLFTSPDLPGLWSSAVLLAYYPLTTALFGHTFGMRLLGLRLVRLADGRPPALPAALVRTVLLMLLIPALISDRDHRGLHDKAAGTIVVRTR